MAATTPPQRPAPTVALSASDHRATPSTGLARPQPGLTGDTPTSIPAGTRRSVDDPAPHNPREPGGGDTATPLFGGLPEAAALHTAGLNGGTYTHVADAVKGLRPDRPADLNVVACLLYLYRADARRYGPQHPLTLKWHRRLERSAHDWALARRLNPCRPVELPLMLVVVPLRGAPAQRLARRVDIAQMLHRHGCCQPATREAVAALHEWLPHARAPVVSATMMARTLSMLTCCARIDEATALLNRAGTLLPTTPADPLYQPTATAMKLLASRGELWRHRDVCAYQPALPDQVRISALDRGQPYRLRATGAAGTRRDQATPAGDAGTPYFVATLTATRSWLYGLLCYSPHVGCWLFYWPSRTHCYLIEGPHNPALRDPGAIDAAQQWAAVFLDEEHALNSLLATGSTGPATSVTEWIAIEWNGRLCWVPLFADTPLCSLPIAARHDSTGILHHCRCRHEKAAMTCEPTTLAGRGSAEKDHDGPAC